MKTYFFAILILCCGATSLSSQHVVVQGTIHSLASNFNALSNSSVFYKYVDAEGIEQISAIPVNQYGIFQQFLPAHTSVQLYIYYNQFVPIDTTIYTGEEELIQLRFHLTAKNMHFNPERARNDINSGEVRIIFHDLEMYRLFRKANFQNKYGFHFEYIPRPESWQDMRDISAYNAEMENYLDHKNGLLWRDELYAEMDSIIAIRESYAGLESLPQPTQSTVLQEINVSGGIPQELAEASPQPLQPETRPDPTQKTSDEIQSAPLVEARPPMAAKETAGTGLLAFQSEPISMPVAPKAHAPSIEFEWESDELVHTLPPHILSPPITTEKAPEIFLPREEHSVPIAIPVVVVDQPAETVDTPSPPTGVSPEAQPEMLPIAAAEGKNPAGYRPLPAVAAVPMAQTESALSVPKAIPAEPLDLPEMPRIPILVEAEAEAEAEVTASNELLLASKDPLPRETGEPLVSYPRDPNSILAHLEEIQLKVLEQAVQASETLYGTAQLSHCPPSWKFPAKIPSGSGMHKLIEDQQAIYRQLYEGKTNWETPDPVAFILEKIDHDPDFQHFKVVQYWAALHYQELIPELIFRLTQTREVGLLHAQGVIIWDRVDQGDLVLDGPGAEVPDDLFTVAGRANYLLKNLTGENFGPFPMGTSEKEAFHLRDRWVSWLLQLPGAPTGASR